MGEDERFSLDFTSDVIFAEAVDGFEESAEEDAKENYDEE